MTVTIPELHRMKRDGEKIVGIVAWDTHMAAIADRVGVEIVSVGDTVSWEFESAGHNVSAVPKDSEKVSLPDGAKPFASHESGDPYAVVEEGKTYEHTFETAGEYTYVCIPHVSSGMVGTVTVTE